ncbi:DUF2076 domain-containing protein [uncultured Alsobacter sp.]|uniref:DUF2076 domain-containing protein n=1 Tax=uncultured Alsobacter sp. TaxID=1748258 RepID=UPI0025E80244|nr:DUF2076 domain-containing protein [uncultured Alsobacter sp.]
MTPEERQLLEGLFDRVKQSATAPRDREAEALIADAVRAQPYAPYLMAQAVIVQEEGLKAAAARIQELEARVAQLEQQPQAQGGFLGGLGKSIFGGDSSAPRTSGSGVPSFGRRDAAAAMPQAPSGPWGGQPQQPQAPGFGGQQMPFGAQQGPAGGGFLRSAMTTAAGVAGGALLFSGIQSLFSSHGSGLGQSLADGAGLSGGGNLSDSVTNALGGTPASAASDEFLGGGAGDPQIDDASLGNDFDDGFDAGGDDGGDWA